MASVNVTNAEAWSLLAENQHMEQFLLLADPYQVLGWVLIVLNTMLSNSAGIGGGPITVSILMYLFGLSSPNALAFSQVSIFGGSIIATIIKMRYKHPHHSKYPLIDYKLCALMAPSLMLGASYGALFTKMFPSWFLLSLLSILVWIIVAITLNKGLSLYKVESNSKKGYRAIPETTKQDDKEPQGLFSAYLGVSLSVFFLVFYSSGKLLLSSFPLWQDCVSDLIFLSVIYHLMTLVQVFWYGRVLLSETLKNSEQSREIYSNKGSIIKLSVLAYATGVVSGTLGIGGGLILNPVLVLLGLNVEVSTACCNLMVFCSSVSSLLQFIIVGTINWPAGLLLFILSMLGSASGTYYIKKKIEEYGRVSLIVLILAGVLTVVGVLIPIQLVRLISTLLSEDRFSFNLAKVC